MLTWNVHLINITSAIAKIYIKRMTAFLWLLTKIHKITRSDKIFYLLKIMYNYIILLEPFYYTISLNKIL